MNVGERIHLPLVIAVALGAAWLIPGHRLGIGVVLVTFALVASVGAAPGVRVTPLGWLGLIVAGGLAVAAVARDAMWVVVPALAMSLSLASIAVRGIGSARELILAVIAPLRVASGGRLLWARVKRRAPARGYERVRPFVRGIGMGGLLLVVFGTLFITADRAFAQLAEQVLIPHVDLPLVPARVAAAVVAFSVSGAIVRRPDDLGTPSMDHRHGGASAPPFGPMPVTWSTRPRPVAEWVTPLVLLGLLFGAFVAVQFAVLFGGHRHVLVTAGLTYAEYARSGFFQLLAAAALTLVVVGTARRLVVTQGSGERRLLESLLGVLCVLTLVVLASATYRLTLYEDAFGFTRARFEARIAMFWIGGVLVLMILSGWLSFFVRNLIPATVVLSVTLMFAVVAVDPDARIARGNVDRFERTGSIDVSYLATLSADAVPELIRLPEPYRSCALAGGPPPAEPWPAANAARAGAREALRGLSLRTTASCWSLGR